LKFRNPKLSVIEGILSRGDRRMSEVIRRAYDNGACLDGWSEHFNFELWEKALTDTKNKIEDLLQFKIADLPLPWEHIEKGISKKFLLDERDRSLRGEPLRIGVSGKDNVKAGSGGGFGRPIKKRISVSAVPTKTKIRIKYSRDERVRFYSHLDMIRAFNRAIRRAGLPVSYSQGFHPHMKLSFGPPLAMGYISRAEYMDILLDSPFEKNHLKRLNENLPSGLNVTASKLIFTKTDSLTKIINCASYQVKLGNNVENIQKKINDLLERKEITVTRIKKEEPKEFSVGRFLHQLTFNDSLFEMLLGFTPDGYIRPSEVMTFGLGFSVSESLSLVYNRTGQYFIQGVHKVEPLDLV